MTTPHPQPDSPPPDVAQLQARIAELEAEMKRVDTMYLLLYDDRVFARVEVRERRLIEKIAKAERAAAAWKTLAKFWFPSYGWHKEAFYNIIRYRRWRRGVKVKGF